MRKWVVAILPNTPGISQGPDVVEAVRYEVERCGALTFYIDGELGNRWQKLRSYAPGLWRVVSLIRTTAENP